MRLAIPLTSERLVALFLACVFKCAWSPVGTTRLLADGRHNCSIAIGPKPGRVNVDASGG